jgi:uncharacterized membrane protein YraQ (UPF0718 family)/copper chaperone CopZ
MDLINIVLKVLGSELWVTLTGMAPYLLLGFAIAGIMAAFVSPDTVERHLGGRGFKPVLKAALFGVPLPLCSCGVIPVAASLRKHGASRGATMAFLLSTPQTGVDSIMVTYALLGPVIAIFRPIAAFFTGLLGGYLTEAVDKKQETGTADALSVCTDECCVPGKKRNWLARAFYHGFIVLPKDISRAMLLGLLVAGVIAAIVPDDFFAGSLGTGVGGIVVMMLVGIPLYVCATASVPIAAALMIKGASAGAALAFLIAGPATNAAAIATIWKVLGRRTTFIYLGTVAITAVLFGLLLDGIFAMEGVKAADVVCHTETSWMGILSAVVLLVVLGAGLFRRAENREASNETHDHEGHHDETFQLKIEGMTCSHCVETVIRALQECVGVESVTADLKTGNARVVGHGLTHRRLSEAIESVGFKEISS